MIDSPRTSIADILEGIGKGLPEVMRQADHLDIELQSQLAELEDDTECRQELDGANDLLRRIDEAATAKGSKYKRLDAVLALLEELN